MKLSRHVADMQPFHALAFGQRADAMEAAGQHVVALSIGEPDFGAPPAVREAMLDVMDGRPLPYTSAFGLPALREAISGFYRDRHGVDVDPARIAITSGASCALVMATAATVDDGDEVILADPSYPCNRELVTSFGGRVEAVPTTAATRYQLDTSAVDRAWSERTTAVMVATPSNPTGTSIPFEQLSAICELARSRGAWRIVDEIYLELTDPDADGRPARTVLETDPDSIVVSSFSKYFGMTGWRLGWMVVPETLVDPVERLAMNFFLSASNPAQQAALACFAPETLAICEERRVELGRRRRLVLDGLARIGLPVPVKPDGAFYVYVDVSGTGLDAWQFCEQALDQAHVALTPGRDFGATTADTHVRLSYAASPDELTEGLDRLGRYVAGLAA
ncbi:aminotransferase class I/II-fold pyridoxal phosphate-dependent enzyme [Acidipropionibacterium acidipropionici]|uniref:Aminotransferase n=1 Tax=Acidipropionibacterium acidipropionici TaxID=1748 RepID=A0AAC9FCK8_9ACTN|nr:aminotransferase class I/II-fold pyridoxal phosphate-dependent enzyme [Acidipropionibacterium acidipropionici]AMS06534.1 aminotransferase [Acidipropionibacterium acidipropionici]AOZ47979.1 aminotransferase [Acidipropionibacterium acidipropionici]AZP38673.1 aminotransferase class I/II-fold pyridoxal phosphate-dependent enzyme [Acidipropionibacterium acidipropionici]